MTSYERQLDLFRLQIAPCGRSSGQFCELERDPASDLWTCVHFGCVAPGGVILPSSW
jgi:hypothetical protein